MSMLLPFEVFRLSVLLGHREERCCYIPSQPHRVLVLRVSLKNVCKFLWELKANL